MKTALYTRVSTVDQSNEPQLIELRNFCQIKGWDINYVFSDVISGAKSSRKGLDELMELVRNGTIQRVIVVKLDRLARSLSHFAQLIQEFAKHNCAFISTSQSIDTSNDNPAARFQVQILGCVAELERSLIRERTIAGLKAAKAAGKRLGRPSLVLPAHHKEIVAIWRAETGGKSIRDLSMRLNGVSLSTAFRLAKEK